MISFLAPGEQCGDIVCAALQKCCHECDGEGDLAVPSGCSYHCPEVICPIPTTEVLSGYQAVLSGNRGSSNNSCHYRDNHRNYHSISKR